MTERGPAADLADLIDQRRKLKGMTTTDLADKSGVSRATIGRFGSLKVPPLPGTVMALANVLDIDHAEALRAAGLGDIYQPAETGARSDLADALRRRLPDLDDATLARVAMAMSDILQGAAAQLFDEANRRRP